LKGNDGFNPEDAVRLFDFIKDKKNFPVLMHTDHEFKENKPTTWEKYIKDYPQIDFIMAHGGKADYKICGEIAKKYPNAYVDTSTISFHRTKTIYEIAGARKILFASDYPYSHLAVELKKYEIIIEDSCEKELILYKNAKKILGV